MKENDPVFHFLLAKYLKKAFPEIGNAFIDDCQRKNLFPVSIFGGFHRYDYLETNLYPDIDHNHIINIFRSICPKILKKSQISQNNTESNSKINDLFMVNRLFSYKFTKYMLKPSKRTVGHFESVTKMEVDATNQILITGSDDSLVKIWKFPGLSLMLSYTAHNKAISSVQIHPTNSFLLSSSIDGTVCLFSLRTGIFVKRIYSDGPILSMKVSNLGSYIGVISENGHLCLWSFNNNGLGCHTYQLLSINPSGTYKIRSFAFTERDSLLVCSFESGFLYVIDIIKGIFRRLPSNFSSTVTFIPSKLDYGTFICFSSNEKSIVLVKSKNELFSQQFDLSESIPYSSRSKTRYAIFNCDETRIVSLSNRSLCVWDHFSREVIHSLINNQYINHPTTLVANPNDPRIVLISGSNNIVRIWNIDYGVPIIDIDIQHSFSIQNVVWTNDGQNVIVSDINGGFTYLSRTTKPFINTQEFFAREIESNNSDSSVVLDQNGSIVEPQPKILKISDIDLKKKDKCIDATDEQYSCEHFRKMNQTMGIFLLNIDDRDITEKDSSLELISYDESGEYTNPTIIEGKSLPLTRNQYETIYKEFTPPGSVEQLEHEEYSESNTVSTSEDDYLSLPNEMPDWVFMCSYEFHTYIPQVGEEIVYFWKGHKHLHAQCSIGGFIPPYELCSNMPLKSFGKIIDIEFALSHLILKVAFHDLDGMESRIVFRLPDSPTFIVPIWKYEESMKNSKNLSINSQVEIPYMENNGIKVFSAVIEKIRKSMDENPFECYTVGFIDGGEMLKVSPWEIIHYEQNRNTPYMIETQDKLSDFFTKKVISKREYSNFLLFREKHQIQTLFVASQIPMDLTLISIRLQNYWYTTIDEIHSNLETLRKNAILLGFKEIAIRNLIKSVSAISGYNNTKLKGKRI